MILRHKPLGYFFFGILLSWHLAWAILVFIIIFSIKNFPKTENQSKLKKKILLFTIGLAISLIFYFYFLFKRNELLSFINLSKSYNYLNILKPELLGPAQVTHHNIRLFDYFSFSVIKFLGNPFEIIYKFKILELWV